MFLEKKEKRKGMKQTQMSIKISESGNNGGTDIGVIEIFKHGRTIIRNGRIRIPQTPFPLHIQNTKMSNSCGRVEIFHK